MYTTGEAADEVRCAKTIARVGKTETGKREVLGFNDRNEAMAAIRCINATSKLNLNFSSESLAIIRVFEGTFSFTVINPTIFRASCAESYQSPLPLISGAAMKAFDSL